LAGVLNSGASGVRYAISQESFGILAKQGGKTAFGVKDSPVKKVSELK